MASSEEFVRYAADQVRQAGEITYRKMFGEYGIYCGGKLFGLICDNQLFIKITEGGMREYPGLDCVPPYEGAKPYLLIENLDDAEYVSGLVRRTCEELPVPVPKKKKAKSPGRTSRVGEKESEMADRTEKKAGKLDYKKEYKDLYLPKTKPALVDVPQMIFIMVDGRGDPNTCPEYKEAIEILYGLSFGIKMSKMSGSRPEGYFEYVVPPLESLWRLEDEAFDGINVTDKEKFCWTAMIRQPEFVTPAVFESARTALAAKKPGLDLSKARLVTYTEGLCCQIMHVGPYDSEPASIGKMEEFIWKSGYETDLSGRRFHHEIYLGDPRRTAPEKLKTVIRHPVKK